MAQSNSGLACPFVHARKIATHDTQRPSPLTTFMPNLLDSRPLRSCSSFDEDGPGESLVIGPRHDNDYTDFRSIRILPTVDEILSFGRSIYMPKKDLGQPHFLPHGVDRLLDTHFRHLRFDETEGLRDICYSAAQAAFLNQTLRADDDPDFRETPSGKRHHIYNNCKVEELIANEQNGMLVRLSFDCPPSLRGPKMHKSNRLQKGMLCAILVLDTLTQELSVIYFDVHLVQSTYSMKSRGTGQRRAAVQLAFHQDVSHEDVLQITRHAHGLCTSTKLVLVEFPSVLHAGFYHALRRLQLLSQEDIAFEKYLTAQKELVENTESAPVAKVSLPAYCKDPEFVYDLSPITNEPSTTKKPEEFVGDSIATTIEYIQANTTLDEGQATALCNSLSREMTFTQGPPGTGKTFLGVALSRILLSSRPVNGKKPILVVCLTNHALDSFLVGLKDAGVAKLLRIGNGSKEEWTKSINLREHARKHRYQKSDYLDVCGLRTTRKHTFGDLTSWCDSVSNQIKSGRPNWHEIEPLLKKSYPHVHAQLITATGCPQTQSFIFDYWASGGDHGHIEVLYKELSSRLMGDIASRTEDKQNILKEMMEDITLHMQHISRLPAKQDIWHLSSKERNALLTKWQSQINREEFAKDLAYLHTQHQELVNDTLLRDQRDLEILQKHNVIGVTTTAVARRWDILRALEPEVLICEEAGEVLEAHALCSLFPSLKHSIFIGDPLQLRPNVKEQSMTLETARGSAYRLDESLFERVMMPRDPFMPILPTSQLNIQRRMHPQIADIVRLTYPFLSDHESTGAHPHPKSIAHRMYWLDHRVPETIETGSGDSISNPYEVEVVKGFVQHLIQGSGYAYGDIAVLTPYAAQLSRLCQALSSTCSLWLSQKDRTLLIEKDLLDAEEGDTKGQVEVELQDMLRVATVDNFQGEEAKVVILSTVRSGGQTGFLKTANRINVACSRAKNGFYIVGNATTLAQVDMWRKVINCFDVSSARGPALGLQCDRHPDHRTNASTMADFNNFADCSRLCDTIRDCGHTCKEKCHDLELHDRLPCLESCNKILPCGHPCQNTCAEKCGPCNGVAETITLDCGHQGIKMCSAQHTECQEVVAERNLSCGRHTVEIKCGHENEDHDCTEKCGILLPCGHDCPGSCLVCRSSTEHQACPEKCNQILMCGHKCDKKCHTGEECPPCQKQCQKACPHGRCQLSCSEDCEPCDLEVPGPCGHENARAICSLPSLHMPCSLPCTKVLACGHPCPSLESEVCPPAEACLVCQGVVNDGQILLYNPVCRHTFSIQEADKLNLQNVFLLKGGHTITGFDPDLDTPKLHLPLCPECTEPTILSAHRYETITKIADLPEVVDRHLLKFGRKLNAWTTALELCEQELTHNLRQFKDDIRPNLLAAGTNAHIILKRHQRIQALQSEIIEFRDQTVTRFEKTLKSLHEYLPQAIQNYSFMFHLHLDALEYRVMDSIITDKLRIVPFLLDIQDSSKELRRQALTILQFVRTECVAGILYCQNAINDKRLQDNTGLDAQIRLYQVRFRFLAQATSTLLNKYGAPISSAPAILNEAVVSTTLLQIKDKAQHASSMVKPYDKCADEFLRLLETPPGASEAVISKCPIIHVSEWQFGTIAH